MPEITNSSVSAICLISFLFISGITLFLSLNLRRNYFKNHREFLRMMISIAVWTFFFMLETYAKSADAKYLCFQLQYFGIIYTLYYFVLYVQKSVFVGYPPGRVQMAVMHALATFFLLSCMFNPHRLFIAKYALSIRDNGFSQLAFEHGPLYYALEYIVFFSFLTGIILIAIHCARGRILLKQAVLVTIAILLPLAASFLYLFGLSHFDATNLFLPLSALCLFISLSNFGMLDNLAFVKKNALNLLDIPVLILDNDGSVSYTNTYADALLGLSHDARRQMSLSSLGLPESLKDGETSASSQIVELDMDTSPKVYIQIRRHALKTRQGHAMGALLTMHNVTEQIALERHLEYVENHDTETGLMNAEMFERMVRTFAEQHQFALAGNNLYAVSIDNYQEIKVKLGAKAHSELVRDIAAYIADVISPNAFLSRQSENEWCIFSNGAPMEIESAQQLLENGRRNMFAIDGVKTHANFKLAVYRITDINVTADQAIDRALYALRSVEQSRSMHFCVYDEHLERQHKLFKDVIGNLGRFDYSGEFELLFQPVVDIVENRIASAEALIYWNHPQFGRISPGRFIEVFENNGEIWRLGLFVLEKACEHIVKWREMLSPDFCISVNVSKKQIERPELFQEIVGILNKHGVEPGMLELEVTETAAVDNIEIVQKFCADVAGFGSGVALDDFGSGNTSLGYITDFTLKKIKFDTNLTNGVDTNASKSVVAQSMLEMCNNLNLPIVVEHVETLQSLESFRAQGFKLIQGFVFSRPLSASDFERYYQEFHLDMR